LVWRAINVEGIGDPTHRGLLPSSPSPFALWGTLRLSPVLPRIPRPGAARVGRGACRDMVRAA
jgi:hypothetical protein